MKNLVFVHGFLGSSLNWGPIINKLKSANLEKWRFFAADLLGHGGRRTSPLGPYSKLSLDLLAEDLWLQLEPQAPFIALGHSFGLRPLLRLYSKHSEAFEALIVEDSSPIVDPENLKALMKILNDTPRPFKSRTEAQEYFRLSYPGKMGAFLLSNIRQNPETELYDWRFDLAGLTDLLDDAFQKPQWNEWASLKIPVKIIRGENSEFLSRDRLQEMQKSLTPTPQAHEVAKAGHWVHSDNPDGFTDILIKLINSLDG